MKVPFGSTLGPFFKNYHQEINAACKPCLFGSQIYLIAFSTVALMITLADLAYIFRFGEPPPSILHSFNPRVCPVLLKNTRLIGIGVNIVVYFLLAIGILFRYPVFLMPYLGINFFNILFYKMLLMITLASNWKCMEKKNIFILSFMVHNWLQVFCFFRFCLNIGDF